MLVPPQVAREASTATALRHAVRTVPAEETSTLDDIVSLPAELGRLRRPGTGQPAARHGRDAAGPAVLRLAARRHAGRPGGAHRHHDGRAAAARPEDRARVLVGRGAARPADAAHRAPAGRAPLLRRFDGVAQDGRPRRGALHGGLAVGPVVPGPPGPGLPQVEPGRARRLPEPARTSWGSTCRTWSPPSSWAASPRTPRSPPRRCGCCGCRSTTGTRPCSPHCPRWTPPRRPGSGFREFVMRDVDGRVQKLRVDVSWVPGLLDYLDTTPDRTPDHGGGHRSGGLMCSRLQATRAARRATAPCLRGSVAFALLFAVALLAPIAVSFPDRAAAAPPAQPADSPPTSARSRSGQVDIDRCIDRLPDGGRASGPSASRPRRPTAPDSGLAGWFASRPEAGTATRCRTGLYSRVRLRRLRTTRPTTSGAPRR